LLNYLAIVRITNAAYEELELLFIGSWSHYFLFASELEDFEICVRRVLLNFSFELVAGLRSIRSSRRGKNPLSIFEFEINLPFEKVWI
jgi:hypothetical protein